MTLAGDRIKLFAHRIIDPHPEQRGSTIARPADERLTKIAMRSSG